MSDIEQDVAEKLKLKFGDKYKDIPNRSNGLPLIVNDTREKLLEEFNLIPPTIWKPEDGPWYPPFMIAEQIAKSEFAILYKDAETFMNATAGWVTSNYRNNPDLANCASAGIVLILRAFHLQNGVGFIEKLNCLNGGALMTQYSSAGRTDERRSIILQARSQMVISPYQTDLQFCVDKLAIYSPDPLAVSDGANAVYSALDKCWSK